MADELISRQTLAEEIESLTVTVAGKPARWYDAKHSVLQIIAEQAAVDAVEVVRCGTPCRWLYDEPDDYCCMNHKGLVKITPDSFCSYGKRREENAVD